MDFVNTFFVIFGKKISVFYVTIPAPDSGCFSCFPLISTVSFLRGREAGQALPSPLCPYRISDTLRTFQANAPPLRISTVFCPGSMSK